MPRCTCKTIKNLRCKNSICAFSQCWSHLNQKYYKHINTIQRIWVGFRTRRMYNIIYKRLPTDLQHKILFYVRENLLIEKHHHNIIQKIMHKKITNTFKNGKSFTPLINLNNLFILYKLANKYFTTLNSNDITILFKKAGILVNNLYSTMLLDEFFEDVQFFLYQIDIFISKNTNKSIHIFYHNNI